MGPTLRVLTFLHSFEPGGVERVALRLVRRWREVGVEAPLFIGRDQGLLRDELAAGLDFAVAHPGSWSERLETLWMIFKLPAEIRRVRPDLLFCAGNTYSVVAVLMKMMMGRKCPPIIAKISNDLILPGLSPWARFWYGRWAWLQARLIDGWVVMHPSMRGDVEAAIGQVELTVIPDPALTTAQLSLLRRWRPRNDGIAGRRFVAMGRLVRQKNYPLMLDAFAAAAASEDCLTIFGDGPERAALTARAAALGLAGQIHFAGHVSQSAEALLDHDILLLSSVYEGIPAALVEGIACGMPIVATDCGDGVRGLLKDWASARLVEGQTVAAFAAAIGGARQFTAERPEQDFDAASFTIEVGADAYLEAFAKVASVVPGRTRLTLVRRSANRPAQLQSISLAGGLSDGDREVA
jgi:glycosyltransferase involved in cell wall biosynthesis